jgi:hypothetical protein
VPRCKIDPALKRVSSGTFQFPLGVYPVESLTPKPGYAMTFEQSDGGGDDDAWEEWPDRYAYDVVISAERLPALCRMLFSLFEGRVYPILDVLGRDAHREIDPYIAYDLVGLDVFLDGVRRYGEFLYEDGMCGFGIMSEDPFIYLFIDEHKIITIRVEPKLRERVERMFQAFDLEATEAAAGADAAAHEHRSVLTAPAGDIELLTPDEVMEVLKIEWKLLLNIDPDSNVDDKGTELGTTHWRSLVRFDLDSSVRYAEVVFDADNLREAEDVTFSAAHELAEEDDMEWDDSMIVTIDRLTPAQLAQLLDGTSVRSKKSSKSKAAGRKKRADTEPSSPDQTPAAGRVYLSRWLD